MTFKTIGHLSYNISSFVHHFVAICEFKMELQSGNAAIWVKIDDIVSRVTLKYGRWPWKTKGHLFYVTLRFMRHIINVGEFKLELETENTLLRSKPMIVLVMWTWNLTDGLGKQ